MKNINDILDKYLAGESSLAEEQKLKKHFAKAKNVPADLEWAMIMFSGFDKVAKEATPVRNLKRRYRRLITIVSSAAVVVLAFTLTIALQPNETIYCYVNGEPVTDIAVARRQVAMISRIASSGEKVALANVEMIKQTAAKGDVTNKAFKYLKLINVE